MIEIIAHRGASREAPENTLASLKKALEIGVDYIELDVHLSLDEVPVVIHDARLGRTVKGWSHQRIVQLTFQELAALDAGSWFDPSFSNEPIPSLQQVLDLKRDSTGVMIEIKKGYSPPHQLAQAVGATLMKAEASNVVVGSFSFPILGEFQQLFPKIPLVGIIETERALEEFLPLKLKRYAIWYKLLTPSLVNKLHEEGVHVWAFTVDDLKAAAFLQSIGVDGIITNDPRQLKTVLQSR